MGFATFRTSHHPGGHHHSRRANTPNPTCATGGFYKAPTQKQTVDAMQPLQIQWDNTCLDTNKADIYLYAPTADRSRVAVWENADFSSGSVTVDLMPRWWNSTASINLQLGIVPAGQAPFLSNLPAGPVFTATYTKPTSGPIPPAADTSIQTSSVINMEQQLGAAQTSHGMTSGKKAAAVLLPLIFIIGCIVFYIKWQRKKAGEKKQRFSIAVDKRMSTISTDWKSVTAAGANAAIRNSMVVGNRSSSFSFGGIRPGSTLLTDDAAAAGGNQAGVGAQMSQMRTGVGLRHPAGLVGSGSAERVSRVSFADTVRQSRVSFANDPRPSMESRRTRAFHEGHVPPVPSLPPHAIGHTAHSNSGDDSSSEEGSLSPTQTQGPLTLTPEDIRTRLAAGSRARTGSNASSAQTAGQKQEMEDVLPALSMMRTDQSEEFLLPTPPPAHTHQTHIPPSPASPPPPMMSPIMSSMPMPAAVMSPDDMLRAYAERKKSSTPVVSGMPISYPLPVANGYSNNHAVTPMSPTNTGNARPLFGPTGVVSPTHTGYGQQHGQQQYSGARYEIGDDEDPYGGSA